MEAGAAAAGQLTDAAVALSAARERVADARQHAILTRPASVGVDAWRREYAATGLVDRVAWLLCRAKAAVGLLTQRGTTIVVTKAATAGAR